MDWMKLGEVNPPSDMRILLWNKQSGPAIGDITYNADGHIIFISLIGSVFPSESIYDFTHWCQIIEPTENE